VLVATVMSPLRGYKAKHAFARRVSSFIEIQKSYSGASAFVSLANGGREVKIKKSKFKRPTISTFDF
jgi:hypothetical protein